MSAQYLLSFFGEVFEVVMAFCCAKGTVSEFGMVGSGCVDRSQMEGAKKKKP
jgi:hypothetical protein